MSILINILLVLNVFVCLLIILLVLMQRPKNEGLGAAFGGGMTDNLFGAQTTNVLQTVTRWLGAIFFILTLTLSFLYVRKTTATSKAQKILSTASDTPPATPVPAATPASGVKVPGEGQPADAGKAPPPLDTNPPAQSQPVELPPPAADQTPATPDAAPAETSPEPPAKEPVPAPTPEGNAPPASADEAPAAAPASDAPKPEDPAPAPEQ